MKKLELVRRAGWLIISDEVDDSGPLFWSNDDGWVGLSGADVYSDTERQSLTLPFGGSWVTASAVEEERTRSRNDHPSSFDDFEMSRAMRKNAFRIIRGARYRARREKGQR